MIVGVTFGNSVKMYCYNTNIKMLKGAIYDIVADGRTNYSTYVQVCLVKQGYDSKLRTITDARLIKGPRRPEKPYKQVVVNKSKRTICVVWKDGTRTVMRCHPEDEWDEEKGIAMCFMKKMFDNRGCYYDTFKDITYMGE